MPAFTDFVLALGALLLASIVIQLVVPAIFPRVGRVLKFVLFAVAVWIIGGVWLGLAWWVLLVVYVLLSAAVLYLTGRI